MSQPGRVSDSDIACFVEARPTPSRDGSAARRTRQAARRSTPGVRWRRCGSTETPPPKRHVVVVACTKGRRRRAPSLCQQRAVVSPAQRRRHPSGRTTNPETREAALQESSARRPCELLSEDGTQARACGSCVGERSSGRNMGRGLFSSYSYGNFASSARRGLFCGDGSHDSKVAAGIAGAARESDEVEMPAAELFSLGSIGVVLRANPGPARRPAPLHHPATRNFLSGPRKCA